MELIDLVNSVYNFSISNDLAQMVNFPTWIPDCDSHSPALSDLFISSDTSICSAIAFLFWSYCFLSFHWLSSKYKTGCPVSSQLMTVLVLIGMVFVIIWEMFHGRISLNSVLLLLLANSVSGFRLEMMCMSFIVSIRSNLTHPYGFQQLVLAHRNHFFRLYQQNKSSESKVKFRQASN